MTNEQRLDQASKMIEEVWHELIPEKSPRTVAEDEHFDFVDSIAIRLLSDIEQMRNFIFDAQL